MPVKRNLCAGSFQQGGMPDWHCPVCTGGYLKLKADSFHFQETSQSRSEYSDPAWEPEWIEYRFSASLICNNSNCQEPVVMSGSGSGRQDRGFDENEGKVVSEEYDVFIPAYVNPSPALIVVPTKCPEGVVSALNRAFVSAWGDFSSAGNHIRTAVEKLLEHLGETAPSNLHGRILAYSKTSPRNGEQLLAIKWIGNAGSHTEQLTQNDIFDALDIFETVLDDLFMQNRAKVDALVNGINDNKGPIK